MVLEVGCVRTAPTTYQKSRRAKRSAPSVRLCVVLQIRSRAPSPEQSVVPHSHTSALTNYIQLVHFDLAEEVFWVESEKENKILVSKRGLPGMVDALEPNENEPRPIHSIAVGISRGPWDPRRAAVLLCTNVSCLSGKIISLGGKEQGLQLECFKVSSALQMDALACVKCSRIIDLDVGKLLCTLSTSR